MGVESQPSPLSGAEPFGKYYLLDRIGAGGMAEVFLAVAIGPEGFQRTLVIKRMLPHLSQDRAFVRMFIDEAKLCGVLSHPNLVQVFEFGKVGESFFIAMEHVRGHTLSAVQGKLQEQGRRAPVAASLEIIRQVCMGLDYAHGLESATGQPLGIVHRDISPSNLMLNFHGGVKILDFGIARVAEEMRDSRTQVGTMKGKVSYMSPEQARTDPVDNRSDIFSVGIVMHEVLSGRRLFRGNNEYSGARMVLESVIPLPSSINPDVTPEVDRVVMRALDRNPDARYQTAGEMARDLEQLLLELRASPHEPAKLLESLFPHGPSRSGEVQLTMTPSPRPFSDSGSGSSISGRTSSVRSGAGYYTPRPPAALADAGLDVEMGSMVSAGTAQKSARERRKWIIASAVSLAAIGGAVLALRPPAAPRPATTGPAAATISTTSLAPAPAAPSPQAPAKAVVQLSLDSTPQDAQVTREDSGEVVGRTPLTIALPRSSDLISFRIEKAGHEPTTYKVIPDLDKAVRVELAAVARTAEPRRAPPPQRRGPPARVAAAARQTKGAAASVAASPAPAADGPRDCALSVASFPWAELWIDGRNTGERTPVVHYAVTCGPHKLGLRRRDLNIDRSEPVTVSPGHELKQHYEIGSDDYAE